MPFYRSVGQIPDKRHTQFRQDDGSLYAEELMGQEGFSSDSSLLYHRFRPTAISSSTEHRPEKAEPVANHPLKPRHFRTHKLDGAGDAITGRNHLLSNADCRISYAIADQAFRRCTAMRSATSASTWRPVRRPSRPPSARIDIGQGDYLIMPMSTIFRVVPKGTEPLRTLVVESTGHITPPKRYLSVRGQFLEHSPYCERDLRSPEEPLLRRRRERRRVRPAPRPGRQHCGPSSRTPTTRSTWSAGTAASTRGCSRSTTSSRSPGGSTSPRPRTRSSRARTSSSATSCRAKWTTTRTAIPVPYNHHNVDSDEVMFYCGGNYEARRGSGIEQGSISLHPSGFTHGPQPGAAERSIGADYFDELAVMVDTFRPLELCEPALDVEDTDYAWTWNRDPAA